MKTVNEMIQELKAAKNLGVNFVSYGYSDLGMPVDINEAISDIQQMDDELIGEGTWYACDHNGNKI